MPLVVEPNQNSFNGFKPCNPCTRITAVGLAAIAASIASVLLTRDLQALKGLATVIWSGVALYSFLDLFLYYGISCSSLGEALASFSESVIQGNAGFWPQTRPRVTSAPPTSSQSEGGSKGEPEHAGRLGQNRMKVAANKRSSASFKIKKPSKQKPNGTCHLNQSGNNAPSQFVFTVPPTSYAPPTPSQSEGGSKGEPEHAGRLGQNRMKVAANKRSSAPDQASTHLREQAGHRQKR